MIVKMPKIKAELSIDGEEYIVGRSKKMAYETVKYFLQHNFDEKEFEPVLMYDENGDWAMGLKVTNKK